ncbi:MAG TPA: DUF2249 domain-containing protein [Trueperaceae bacterium]|nr:DUF2249 domain-containing protein [Trueperaceae bacterium]
MSQASPDQAAAAPTTVTPDEAVARLNKLFDSALRALGDADQQDAACELAAQGWTLLRHSWPREGERLNGVLHYLTRTVRQAPARAAADDTLLEVRHLIPAERHRVIFETYFALASGSAFVLVNDHDPKPLYYQFAAEHPSEFTWEPLEEGPEVWRVRIAKV